MNRILFRHVQICSASALAVCSASVAAQAAEEPITEITFDLAYRYDTNVSGANEQLAAERGLEQEDFVFSPNISVNVLRPFANSSLYVRGNISYNIHARNERLDREGIDLEAGGTLQAGPCQVSPYAGVRRGQSDLSDLVLIAGGPAAVPEAVSNTETVQRYGAELACGAEYGLQPVASVSYEDAQNSNILRQRAEYESFEFLTGLRYVHPTQGQVTAFASRRDVDLPGLNLLNGAEDGYREREVGLRYERSVGPRLDLSASVAYSKVDSSNPLVGDPEGVVWDLGATVQLGTNVRVFASTGREIANTLTSDAAFNVSKPHAVRVEYAPSERLRFEGGGQWTERRYDFGFIPAGDFIERDDLRIYDIAATYSVRERVDIRLAAAFEERDANGTVFDYDAFSTILSLRFRL